MTKVCTICKEEKSTAEFYFAKSGKGGLRGDCKPCTILRAKQTQDPHKRKVAAANRYLRNKETICAKTSLYQKLNKNKVAVWVNRYKQRKKDTDPIYIISLRLRARLRNAIRARGFTKSGSTERLLGASYDVVCTHLLKTWEQNYPGEELFWDQVHIDHIVPLASASTEDELVALSLYTNLQLLKARDNLVKKDKMGGLFK